MSGAAITACTGAAAVGFTADWLSLREPADAAARDAALTAQLAQMTRHRAPARFIDLGCGTGANLRYLAPRIGGPQEWLLLDSDSVLLAQVRGIPECAVETRCMDIASGLDALEIAGDAVVTASALLDLVSDVWLERLVERCRAWGATALFALSYDGRMSFAPSDIDDEWLRQLVNHHQLGDKGFGPALGPGAATRVCERFADVGYDVRHAPSDWNLEARDGPLQRQLIEGWARAAAEVVAEEALRCQRWLERRLAHVEQGTSRVTVGHQDVLLAPR